MLGMRGMGRGPQQCRPGLTERHPGLSEWEGALDFQVGQVAGVGQLHLAIHVESAQGWAVRFGRAQVIIDLQNKQATLCKSAPVGLGVATFRGGCSALHGAPTSTPHYPNWDKGGFLGF